jgi:hypothetical protein
MGPTAEATAVYLVDDLGHEHRDLVIVLVSNNPYALDRPLARGTRPTLSSGQLGIAVIDAPGDSPRPPGRARGTPRLEVRGPEPVHAGVDGEAVNSVRHCGSLSARRRCGPDLLAPPGRLAISAPAPPGPPARNAHPAQVRRLTAGSDKENPSTTSKTTPLIHVHQAEERGDAGESSCHCGFDRPRCGSHSRPISRRRRADPHEAPDQRVEPPRRVPPRSSVPQCQRRVVGLVATSYARRRITRAAVPSISDPMAAPSTRLMTAMATF